VTTTAVPGEPDPREAEEAEPHARYRRFDCTADDPSRNAEATEAARQAIEAGECIVLPTDTVYGIGVDAFSAKAVQRLLDAKQRGRDMPPPVLIGEPTLIRALAVDVPEKAKDLVDKHWPGALTVICRIQPSLRMDLGETEGTIALRVPDHGLAREILRRTGPMAVSSANISGKPAALTCDEAIEQLGDSVAVYLDGGQLQKAGGAPSTIVDFTRHEDGQVLRRGAISLETLREIAPNLLDLTDESEGTEDVPSTGSGRGQDEDEPSSDLARSQDEDEPSPSSGPNPATGG
jgi:tRNA threonylcarbamoyl adenosine modification protein (Sua5/YciO/YrdC/YwlC family)